MIFREYVGQAVRSLVSAKLRTVLALVGIVIGIGSVIALVSIGVIVENRALSQFRAMGTNVLQIRNEEANPGKGLPLKPTLDIPKFCPQVERVAPFISFSVNTAYGQKKNTSTALGVTGDFSDICRLKVRQGRTISSLDKDMYFCVLSHQLYLKLFGPSLPRAVGAHILLNGYLFTVVGVLKKMPDSEMRPYATNTGLLIPLGVAPHIGTPIVVQQVLATVKAGGDRRQAEAQVKRFLRLTDRRLHVSVMSAEQIIKTMESQTRMFTLFLGAIGSIALLVGGIGIMNVMLASVAERKKEIGIRRAVGAKRSDIKSQFLTEAVILCLAGGLMGILLGVGASYLTARIAGWPFVVSTPAMLLGVGVSLAVGLFFGFYPARKAARLNPIDALRSE